MFQLSIQGPSLNSCCIFSWSCAACAWHVFFAEDGPLDKWNKAQIRQAGAGHGQMLSASDIVRCRTTALVSTGASIVLPNSSIWAVNGVRWCPRTDELDVANVNAVFFAVLYSFLQFCCPSIICINMSCGHCHFEMS